MGTVILFEPNIYLKRYYAGNKKGVSYSLRIDESFTKLEFINLIQKLISGLDI